MSSKYTLVMNMSIHLLCNINRKILDIINVIHVNKIINIIYINMYINYVNVYMETLQFIEIYENKLYLNVSKISYNINVNIGKSSFDKEMKLE